MWLVTTFGYFSIVQKNSDREAGTLTVRSRIHRDLEMLRDKYLPGMSEISRSGGADYPYRAKARREDLAQAFAAAIMDLAYSNFKAETALQLGHRREDAYNEVWLALRKLQQLEKPSTAKEAADRPATRVTAEPAAVFE